MKKNIRFYEEIQKTFTSHSPVESRNIGLLSVLLMASEWKYDLMKITKGIDAIKDFIHQQDLTEK